MRKHPHRPMFAMAGVLMGTAVAAFAVAPSDIDTPLPDVRVLEESTPTPLGAIEAQLQALQIAPVRLSRTTLSRKTDTTDALLRRLGISDADAAGVLRRHPSAAALLESHTDCRVQAESAHGRLTTLVIRGPALDEARARTHFTRLTLTRQTGPTAIPIAEPRFNTQVEYVPYQVDARVGGATILDSLFTAADAANLPDSVTDQLGEIFGSDIDFRRDLRRGDRFTVVYQAYSADGESAPWLKNVTSRILAARFYNDGQRHEAMWFQKPGQRGAYYTLDGRNKQRQFLPAPLEHSRVTSGFKMRFHPVLKQWRQHLGTDYGAPHGTPVRTVGEGVVTFAGVQGGYGNVVIVQHNGDRETRYAHLSRINVRKGQTVSQGQLIGAVGATGWATGPHLHFEFRVRDQHVDPQTVARNSEATRIDELDMPAFKAIANIAHTQLRAATTTVASLQHFE